MVSNSFIVSRVITRRLGTLERKKYELVNLQNYVVQNASGSRKTFYASELYKINPNEDVKSMTMDEALELNKVKRNKTDALSETIEEEEN